MRRVCFLLAVICFTSGQLWSQASLVQIKNAPMHAGESRIFEAPYKSLVKFSQEAMREARLELELVEKIDGDTYMIIGKKRASGFSWGEMVRIIIIGQKDPSKSIVRVYTKKRIKINITAKGDYSQTIFSSIETKIDLSTDDFEPALRPVASPSRSEKDEGPNDAEVPPEGQFEESSLKNKVALIIGNASYRSAPLKNPVNDANAISAELRNSGFEVLKYTAKF